MALNFLKYSKIYYIFSGLLAILAIISIVVAGFRFGIDFTGGSIMELEFETRPENSVIREKLENLNLGEITVQPTGETGVILRLKDIDESVHQSILKNLGEISGIVDEPSGSSPRFAGARVEESRFESIGPVIGRELRQKTIILIVVSLFALLIYVAVSFRKVTFPFSGWQFGIVSIVALFFDVLIPISVFALLGKFYNVQFSIPIVTALLTILGYTINDKVIVFDRVRENVLRVRGIDFEVLVNRSLNEILFRSLSTGTCTLMVLFFIFLLGGETLKYFALTLIIGITVGTYSSLFLASPLLVSWLRWKER